MRISGISIFSQMMLLLACGTFLLACNGDSKKEEPVAPELSKEVKNESVHRLIEEIGHEAQDETDEEDVKLSAEEQKKAKEQSTRRLKLITEEIESSKYKTFSDDELRTFLENELESYRSSCDSLKMKELKRKLNSDAVIKTFRSNNVEYARSFLLQFKEAIDSCSSQ